MQWKHSPNFTWWWWLDEDDGDCVGCNIQNKAQGQSRLWALIWSPTLGPNNSGSLQRWDSKSGDAGLVLLWRFFKFWLINRETAWGMRVTFDWGTTTGRWEERHQRPSVVQWKTKLEPIVEAWIIPEATQQEQYNCGNVQWWPNKEQTFSFIKYFKMVFAT